MSAQPESPSELETLVYESDWLASRPFFYNVRTGAASHNINEVIDLADIEFDPEGFNDYLDFGFCVFGRTPVRDVRMLRHSARVWRGRRGLRVEHLEDPTSEGLERRTTVDEVLEVASAMVNDAADGVAGEIVIPTSGGFDSRFMNVLVRERSRVRAFTYGTSDRPEESLEAVKAAELARRLGVRHELIPLGRFHAYIDAWDGLFGVATHAHGMYQMEFYKNIAARVGLGRLVLSGSCGDRIAGADLDVRWKPVLDSPRDVYELFNFGGMHADSSMSRFKSERLGGQELLAAEPRLRTETRPRVVAMERIRLSLLSYLVTVPEWAGFRVLAPYLDIELGLRMLTLPDELRDRRRWQRDLFARNGVDLEAESWKADPQNSLNYQAMRRVPLRPLDVNVLSEVVRPDYVRWVNRTVGVWGLGWEAFWRLNLTPGFRRTVEMLKRMGVSERRLPAYAAYLTLRPIESLLVRRDRMRGACRS